MKIAIKLFALALTLAALQGCVSVERTTEPTTTTTRQTTTTIERPAGTTQTTTTRTY